MPRGRKAVVVDDPVVEGVTDVHAGREYDSNVKKFREAVTSVIGAHLWVYLARRDGARMSRLSTGELRMRPLRWSSLSPEQQKSLEDVVPYRGVDDLVSYGDTVIMVTDATLYAQVMARRRAATRSSADVSLETLSRETGLRIEDRWEDLPTSAVPKAG